MTLDLRSPAYSLALVASTPLVRGLVDGLLTLVLNRPEQRNAIDPELCAALAGALDDAATTREIRAVVVTGAGGTFCSGGDLGSVSGLGDPDARHRVSERLSALIERFERLEKPTIAVVDGAATGAGLALALAADWRIGTPRTRLLYREGGLGMIATHGGCARLVKLVGLSRAREAMLGGDDLGAEQAYRLGLLSEVVAVDALAAAGQRADRMRRRAPLSYGAAKRVLALAADVDTRSGMLAERLEQAALLRSEDHHEGVAAFRDGREPVFVGR
jgi:enoyl-CoA hydratase/carnithine racemase